MIALWGRVSLWMLCVVTAEFAYATPITWEFEGVVSFVRVPVDELNLDIRVGDKFSGSMTWDDEWVESGSNGIQIDFQYGWSVLVGDHTFDVRGSFEVARSLGYIQLQSTGAGSVDGFQTNMIQPVIALDGVVGNIPIDPSSLLADTVNWRWFQIAFNSPNAQPFYGGTLNSVAAVHDVSGPSTFSLLFTGLLIFVLRWLRLPAARTRPIVVQPS